MSTIIYKKYRYRQYSITTKINIGTEHYKGNCICNNFVLILISEEHLSLRKNAVNLFSYFCDFIIKIKKNMIFAIGAT